MTVEVQHLRRVFGTTVAVADLSFSFGSGDVLGLIGPNGCGKTTTMRLMTGLDEPTAGDVLVDGVSAVDYPDRVARRIGFMPDFLPSQSDITAHEYVDFFARAAGFSGAELARRVREAEAFVNLTPIRDKVISQLSKGMKQRVSLARAIVHDPGLLVLDEPASGLDLRARLEFREYVKRLAAAGKAILISSHILADLEETCNGCLVMEKGELVRRIEGPLKGLDLEKIFLESTKGVLQ